MAANFLHGVEFIEVERGVRPFRVPKTAVIGLVGTAPIHQVALADRSLNRPTLIKNSRDAVRFFGEAKNSTGYTIPKALEAIAQQGGALVIVVNVFNPATHQTLGADIATSGSHSITANIATVTTAAPHGLLVGDTVSVSGFAAPLAPLNQTSVRVKTVPNATTLTFDLVNPDIAATVSTDGIVKKVTYAPNLVTAADIIGGTTITGERYGMEAFRDAQALFNFGAKIIIAPAFSPLAGVRTTMVVIADALKAITIADIPAGSSVADAISSRGNLGPFNYNTASPRMVITYPHVKTYDKATDTTEIQPMSAYVAGVIGFRDTDRGWWWSPSNVEIKGIVGAELPLTSDYTDANSETNLLNEVGIMTLYSEFGTGIRTWGNRSAMWPSGPHPKNFINIQRIQDVVQETIARNMLPFIDRPISEALIDSVLESINAFINGLVTQGALITGSNCYFNPDNNPTDQLALGRIWFSLQIMGPTPAERFTFDVFMDSELLRNIMPTSN
jgi:uncharacterized protein